ERRLEQPLGLVELHLVVGLLGVGERLVGVDERLVGDVGRRQDRGERREAQPRVGGGHLAHRRLDGLLGVEARRLYLLPPAQRRGRRRGGRRRLQRQRQRRRRRRLLRMRLLRLLGLGRRSRLGRRRGLGRRDDGRRGLGRRFRGRLARPARQRRR